MCGKISSLLLKFINTDSLLKMVAVVSFQFKICLFLKEKFWGVFLVIEEADFCCWAVLAASAFGMRRTLKLENLKAQLCVLAGQLSKSSEVLSVGRNIEQS